MSERARAIRQAVNRFAFHRDQHHGWRKAAAWLLLCNALTVAAFAGFIALHSTVYITVAATPDGRLVPLTPLDQPLMSHPALPNCARPLAPRRSRCPRSTTPSCPTRRSETGPSRR